MSDKKVTAQDIWDAFDANECLSLKDGLTSLEDIEKEKALKAIDALLSQVRQEARREALKEMDEAWLEHCAKIAVSHRHISFDCDANRLRQEYQS